MALGIGTILFALEGSLLPSYLEELGEILGGVAPLVAPWAVGYESERATTNSIVAGVAVIVFAVRGNADRSRVFAWWHDRSHGPRRELARGRRARRFRAGARRARRRCAVC